MRDETLNPMIDVMLEEGAYLPDRAHDTDAGADIRCRAGFTLASMGSAVIRTGVHVQLPHHTAGMIKSKSGLNVRHGIVGEGVIDEGFTGEVIVRLYNHSREAYHFDAGDKITQLVVIPVLYPDYREVDRISGGERGDAGYGSTGR